MKPEPTQDPFVAMVQSMLNGSCTREKFREAERAAFRAEFAHLSDAELEAQYGPSPAWAKKLTDDELDDAVDLLSGDATLDQLAAFLSTCKALTPEDVEEFRRDFREA